MQKFKDACGSAEQALENFERDWLDARMDPSASDTMQGDKTNDPTLVSAIARIFRDNNLETSLQADIARYEELSKAMGDRLLAAQEEMRSANCIVPEGVPGQPMPEPEPEFVPGGRWGS